MRPRTVLLGAIGAVALVFGPIATYQLTLSAPRSTALLLAEIGVLSWSAIHGHYAYRSVVRSINRRVPELPLANEFNSAVGELRVEWYVSTQAAAEPGNSPLDASRHRSQFADRLTAC